MAYKKKDMEQMTDALVAGGLTLQAVPMLRAEGRTIGALTDTATGFVGIGVAGSVAKMSYGMVKSPSWGLGKKKKLKGRYR